MTAGASPEKITALRAAPRLLQILRVLARRKFLGVLLGKKRWPPPKEVRETFEELGLVFLKFGQVLEMRHDMLPAAYIAELELLHDELPAMELDAVRVAVETDLGSPLQSLFSSFGKTPLAAATIAQVHEATLHDGRHVAVKVQRPGLQAIISTDIAALTYLVALGERIFPSLRALDLPVVVSHQLESGNGFQSGSAFHRALSHGAGGCARPMDEWRRRAKESTAQLSRSSLRKHSNLRLSTGLHLTHVNSVLRCPNIID